MSNEQMIVELKAIREKHPEYGHVLAWCIAKLYKEIDSVHTKGQ